MNFPSTNTDGANPAIGNIISNVGSSHGVKLSGGSTGGVVTAVGDDANISITVTGKGSGLTILGSSSAPVRISGSTTSFVNINRFFVQATVPALSSASAAESTVTLVGLTTNAILMLQNRLKLNSTVTGVTAKARCSTADELTIEWHNVSQSSLSGSTVSFYLLAFQF